MTNGEALVRGAEQRGLLVVGVMGFRNNGDFSLAVSNTFREWLREELGRADRVAEVVAGLVRNAAAKPLDDLEMVWNVGEGE